VACMVSYKTESGALRYELTNRMVAHSVSGEFPATEARTPLQTPVCMPTVDARPPSSVLEMVLI